MITIHVKGDDSYVNEEATELVIHKVDNNRLLVEIFTHNDIAAATGVSYLQFNISREESLKLYNFFKVSSFGLKTPFNI